MELNDILSILSTEKTRLLIACNLTEELYEKLQNPTVKLQERLTANLQNPVFAEYWHQLNYLNRLEKLIQENYLPF